MEILELNAHGKVEVHIARLAEQGQLIGRPTKQNDVTLICFQDST